ncbi:hypothetical protein [Simiduia agarivorans]|uniref:Uncharacterized protein n=1 Tax=Simiduia agarivorans (strain DSM 21679 / JCM 13881 / BCRC 17597 / SA1) TaxID=1117647 RepID=K4KZL4_SIMAS|nr:hypothetical protein [Simiduia agarivorans]AFU99372.1 hypothetical protein M5M_10975 [Simiduia agarivorans SA1 = DSM 21679]
MNKDEFDELYRFLRSEVSRAGFSYIDQVIDGEFNRSQEGKEAVESYLEYLIKMLRERNFKMGDSVLDELNGSIETKSGNPIKEIEIVLSNEESQRYKVKSESLRKGVDYSPLIISLESFKKKISNTPEHTPRGPSGGPSFP